MRLAAHEGSVNRQHVRVERDVLGYLHVWQAGRRHPCARITRARRDVLQHVARRHVSAVRLGRRVEARVANQGTHARRGAHLVDACKHLLEPRRVVLRLRRWRSREPEQPRKPEREREQR